MCDHCSALGKDLSRCARCQHAHYCGKACQKAAWRDHKATCKQLCEDLKECERVRGRRLFYHDVYLVEMLHVRLGPLGCASPFAACGVCVGAATCARCHAQSVGAPRLGRAFLIYCDLLASGYQHTAAWVVSAAVPTNSCLA